MLLGILKKFLSIYDICLVFMFIQCPILVQHCLILLQHYFLLTLSTARYPYFGLAHLFSSLKEVHLYSYDQNQTNIHRVLQLTAENEAQEHVLVLMKEEADHLTKSWSLSVQNKIINHCKCRLKYNKTEIEQKRITQTKILGFITYIELFLTE